jgi:UDPglucose 6-dehydrogenase
MVAKKPLGAGATMNIAVVGLWHLGCVTAACCAEHFNVVGLDFDEVTIANLQRGKAPLFEPDLDALIQRGLQSGQLSFTTNARNSLENADVIWVCFDTPMDEHDVADTAFVLDRLEGCLLHLRADVVVLISSQIPVGTCRWLEQQHAQRSLSFAYSPENLRLGKALEIFRQPDRVVAGVRDQPTRDTLAKLFAPFAGERVLWMSPESAEMTKHAINSFLALSIAFANEIARLCEAVGADASDVERGLRSESRIGQKAYIRPGSAFAGGTLARDVVTLSQIARNRGESSDLIAAILSSNEAHKGWALRRLEALFRHLNTITVAVLGLTYKPGTDTLRRSSSVELCSALLGRGCRVHCFDPAVKVLPRELAAAKLFRSLPEALHGVDATVIATEWPQIKDADWPELVRGMKEQAVILDANKMLNLPSELFRSVRYLAVGTPAL